MTLSSEAPGGTTACPKHLEVRAWRLLGEIKKAWIPVLIRRFPDVYPMAPRCTLRYFRRDRQIAVFLYFSDQISIDFGKSYIRSDPLQRRLKEFLLLVDPKAFRE